MSDITLLGAAASAITKCAHILGDQTTDHILTEINAALLKLALDEKC